MSLTELLGVIDDADAVEPKGRKRIILHVHAPRLLHEAGKYLGHEEGRPVYGYTRQQAHSIRAAIYAAAREDAETGALDRAVDEVREGGGA